MSCRYRVYGLLHLNTAGAIPERQIRTKLLRNPTSICSLSPGRGKNAAVGRPRRGDFDCGDTVETPPLGLGSIQ